MKTIQNLGDQMPKKVVKKKNNELLGSYTCSQDLSQL